VSHKLRLLIAITQLGLDAIIDASVKSGQSAETMISLNIALLIVAKGETGSCNHCYGSPAFIEVGTSELNIVLDLASAIF
jgi:hypothetical protein